MAQSNRAARFADTNSTICMSRHVADSLQHPSFIRRSTFNETNLVNAERRIHIAMHFLFYWDCRIWVKRRLVLYQNKLEESREDVMHLFASYLILDIRKIKPYG